MSDIKVLGSGVPGAVDVATDEISDVHWPKFKMAYGADGVATQVDSFNPLPVMTPSVLIEGFESITGVTGSTDVSNIATSTEHRGVGSNSVSFDKSGTTQTYALLEKTITSVDLTRFSGIYDIEFQLKLPSLADVSVVYVALGSSLSDNIYWQTSVADLTAGWNAVQKGLVYPDAQIGVGIDYANITWLGVYVGFNATSDTLAGIKVDNVELHPSNLHFLENIADSTPNTVTIDGRKSQYTVSGFSDAVSMHLDIATNSTLIAVMLVDISDTTNWKHTNTGEIVIDYIVIEVDPSANFLGEVKIGYLTNVDGTNGDFNQILDIDMARKADLFAETVEFGSHGIHCSDTRHFGPIIANSTLFQTDVNLGGPDDPATLTYPSGNGDLVMIIDGDGTNSVDVSLTIGYETVA